MRLKVLQILPRKSFQLLSIGIASTVLILTSTAGPVTAVSTPAIQDGIFVVTSGGEPLENGIARQAAKDPAYKEAALKLLDGWKSGTAASRDVPLNTVPSESVIDNALSMIASPETVPQTSQSPSTTRTASTPGNTATYPVRGGPLGDFSYWGGNPMLQIDGQFCGSSGCRVTDRYVVRATVSPGVQSSRIELQSTYFPNSGNFSAQAVSSIAITRGRDVGYGRSVTGGGGPSGHYLNSWERLSGKRLTVALELNLQTPRGPYFDAAKTADCIGRTGSDTRCFYQ
ncbi:hypothetical protein JOE69_002151 [Arthrobacter russicus]|uniref:Uncharacterized protein n=1 Tax=Arthrobacter russicus TaxID=172040 RepID=A0ABU1JBV7_9MICC|nr:hypothetical protein [Arthrobacter russicus]